jgi:hypothetical protein
MSLTRFHNLGRLALLPIAGLSLNFTVCAEPASGKQVPGNEEVAATSATHWLHDQVVARIALEQAPIASVAEAQVKIALYRAKQKTEQNLCAGYWTNQGAVLNQRTPAILEQTDQSSKRQFWLFQSSWSAQTISCPDTTRKQFFLEMSRHLPEWIEIRPAGPVIAFQQGEATFPQPHTSAVR